MNRIWPFTITFAAGAVAGILCIRLLGDNVDRSDGSKGVEEPNAAADLSTEEVAEPFVLPGENESNDSDYKSADLSGEWISGDGEQNATVEGEILAFGKTADWPDLQGREFLVGEQRRFLTASGLYFMSWETNTMIFIKEDRVTESLSRLTLYRKGSRFAGARPPLPRTPPPPSIQALLDLVPEIREGETLEAVFGRIGPEWDGKMTVIGGESGLGESDTVFDLGVNGEWMLEAKHILSSGKVLRFRVVRGYAEARGGQSPDVRRVVFPYFEFGKIITGPMEARPAKEE